VSVVAGACRIGRARERILRAEAWSNAHGTTAGFARRFGRMAVTVAGPWDLITASL